MSSFRLHDDGHGTHTVRSTRFVEIQRKWILLSKPAVWGQCCGTAGQRATCNAAPTAQR